MPFTISKANGQVLTTKPMFTQEGNPDMEAKKMEKTNQIETPEEAEVQVGEAVEVSNPIIYYSDQPGAGPDDLTPEEQAEATKKAEAAQGKAVAAPPSNKAQSGPKGAK